MSRSQRCTCAACGAIGHTVNRCPMPAAADYWRAAAVRLRAQAEGHGAASSVAALHGDDDEATYHRRAKLLALDDAWRAERKAMAPGGKLEAVPKPRGKQ